MTPPRSLPHRLAAGLVLLTFVAFLPVLRNGFIGLDDGVYITLNPHVSEGLTWGGVKWAFQAGYSGNWHPLTWLSHMLDVELFGLNPAGHHLVNLLIHCANVVLLFAWLSSATRAVWRSAVVAALFAVHPLHVESVAWAAERKDVLSTLFLFLTLWAYTEWTRQRREAAPPSLLKNGYLLAIGCFAFGLMSKPMLVTVPFILLLIDHWPLGRIEDHCSVDSVGFRTRCKAIARLIWEKVPFFVMAAGASSLTLFAQRKGEAFWLDLPLMSRVGNAVASYCKYLSKTIWPVDLAVFYPHPDTGYPQSSQWPDWVLIIAAAALMVVTMTALLPRVRRTAPWAATGWLWYLGTLVPVIGIVQVGLQGMADRYAYIPLVGVFVCVVWAGAEWLKNSRALAAACASGALIACAVLTWAQANRWRDNMTLFSHALAVTDRNAVAHYHVGMEFDKIGNGEQAEAHLRAALSADPKYYRAHYALGALLQGRRDFTQALEHYRVILQVSPESAAVRSRVAACLAALGRKQEAESEYLTALQSDPSDAETEHNLAVLYAEMGKPNLAVEHFAKAARLQSDVPQALAAAAEELLRRGRFLEAEVRFAGLVRFDASEPVFHVGLGRAFLGEGNIEAAREAFEAAKRLLPGDKDLELAVDRWLAEAGATNSATATRR